MNIFKTAAACALLLSFSATSFGVTKAEYEADKNNLDLARQYAAELFAARKFSESLEVIEEIIIAKPVDLSARFFRVQVMMALGRGDEVLDELEFMTTLKLSSSDMDRAKQLIAAIQRDESPLSATVSFKAGFEYNDNANNYNDTGYTYSTTDGVTWTAGSTARTDTTNEVAKSLDDTRYSTSVGYFGKYALNDSKSRNLNFALTSAFKNGTKTVNADGTTNFARIGWEENFGNWKTELSYSRVSINKKHNLNKAGTSGILPDTTISIPGISLSYKFGKQAVTYGYTSAKSKNTGFSSASDYDNTTNKHKLSLSSPVGKSSFALLSYETGDYTSTDTAVKDAYDKDLSTNSGSLITIWKPGHRTSLKYSTSSKDNKYEFSAYKRKDTTNVLTANYTMAGDVLYEALKDWNLIFGYTKSVTDSNNPTYDVKSNSYGLTVERRWSQF